MTKTIVVTLVCMVVFVAPVAWSETIIPITDFEDSADWSWSGGNITGSFVDAPWDMDAISGENALVIFYNNSGEWNYQSMNFPIDPVDISGAREIRMSIYFTPDSTGELRLRLDLPRGDFLGFANVPLDENGEPIRGEWHELSWFIDRYASMRQTSVGSFNGFLVPTPTGASGEAWIDNIYAVIPDDLPEIEEVILFDFSSADPATGGPSGWSAWASASIFPELADGLVEPTVGSNAMMFFAGAGGVNNVISPNAKDLFDRWQDVVDVNFDVRAIGATPGGWLQCTLSVQSGRGDTDEFNVTSGLVEQGFYDFYEEWKTIGNTLNIAPHLENISAPDGWIVFRLHTNNGGEGGGHELFMDNFRLGVLANGVSVEGWAIY